MTARPGLGPKNRVRYFRRFKKVAGRGKEELHRGLRGGTLDVSTEGSAGLRTGRSNETFFGHKTPEEFVARARRAAPPSPHCTLRFVPEAESCT